jgi:hypothetical protein
VDHACRVAVSVSRSRECPTAASVIAPILRRTEADRNTGRVRNQPMALRSITNTTTPVTDT